MMPEITKRGTSFRGAYLYYFHDKKARTTDRVAWTHTANMMTDRVDKAWRVMAYTAENQSSLKRASGQRATGQKMKKPVFAYSLAWHPEQKPEKEEMLKAANQSLEALGLTEHEIMMAAHKDEPQQHVHIVVNTVHPVTGLVANLEYTKRKVQDWATEYEREHGKVYCKMRDESFERRKQGEKTKYANPDVINAWEQSDDAKGFVKLMEEKGYHLAQGRKRLVMVDPHGKTFNPTRDLSANFGKGAPDAFRERMAEIDTSELPTPKAILEQRANEVNTTNNTDEVVREFNEKAKAKEKPSQLERPKKAQKPSQQPDKYGASNDNNKPLKSNREKWLEIYEKRMSQVRKSSDIQKDRKEQKPLNDNQKKPREKLQKTPEKVIVPEKVIEQPDHEKWVTWKDRKIRLHEERAATALARKTSAHHEEKYSMAGEHKRVIDKKHVELEDYYELDKKQRHIDRLQHSLEKPKFLQKITQRFFGGEEKTRHQIDVLQANRKSAEQRYNEQIGALEKQRDRALDQLKRNQEEDLKRLNQKLKQMEPTERSLSQEWSKIAHRQQDRDRSHDRGRDGPSISR